MSYLIPRRNVYFSLRNNYRILWHWDYFIVNLLHNLILRHWDYSIVNLLRKCETCGKEGSGCNDKKNSPKFHCLLLVFLQTKKWITETAAILIDSIPEIRTISSIVIDIVLTSHRFRFVFKI